MTKKHHGGVVFLARSLDHGGAERQLVALAKGLASRGHAVSVVTFYTGGAFANELSRSGIEPISLGKAGRWDVFPFLIRLYRTLREARPDVVHGYLSVPNLLSVLLQPFLPKTRIVWGVRASYMDLSRYDWLSRLAYCLESRLARRADLIIANSRAGADHAVANGWPGEKILVIPNGIDISYFQPDFQGRAKVRNEWGVADDEVLIGLVARLDPMKDHPTFLQAAARIARECPHARFACVGGGRLEDAARIQSMALELGLGDRLIMAGARNDMPAVFSAFDVASSSSYGEGFSNAIAEAMACGVTCVTTDVGDAAWIIGQTGTIVPPRDPLALADAWGRLVVMTAEERWALGAAARDRVVAEFGVEVLVTRSEQALGLS